MRRTLRPGAVSSAVTVLCAGVFSSTVPAQTLMQANISAAMARKIVDAIVAECGGSGDLLTVTIAVVDRAGAPVMELRADTASPHNWELAFRKAYTARTYRRTTLDVRDRTAGDAPFAGQRLLSNVAALGGGVPIIKDGDGIGGIGVSGAEGGQDGDHACAMAGLAAIADDLE